MFVHGVLMIFCAILELSYQLPSDRFFETFSIDPNTLYDDTNRNAIAMEDYLWPNGMIPFKFDDAYTSMDRDKIFYAINIIEDDTCIKFVETNQTESQQHHIKFVKSKNDCGAMIGYHPSKNHSSPVSLTNSCITQKSAILHELLHVIGLFHHQCRYDRDNYIEILWDNVDPSQIHNFDKVSEKYSTTFDLAYDFHSLMHYPRHAFSRDGKSFTMIMRNDSTVELGPVNFKNARPSSIDFEMVNRMYNC
jgi:hypothetical protein